MASISWFSCLHIRPLVREFSASAAEKGVLLPITLEHHKQTLPSTEKAFTVDRRLLILQAAVAAFTSSATVPDALALNDVSEDVRIYTDDANKFKIAIPQGFYYIEYSLQSPGESRKHLYSAIGMASNGWYNRLYTVTGQFVEEEATKYASKIKKAVGSFRFI